MGFRFYTQHTQVQHIIVTYVAVNLAWFCIALGSMHLGADLAGYRRLPLCSDANVSHHVDILGRTRFGRT